MTKVSEQSSVFIGARSADIVTPATGSVYRSVGKARRIYAAAIAAAALGSGKKLSVTLKQATAADGTGSKALGSTVEVVEPTAPVEVDAFVENMDIAGGFTYVSVTISSDNGSAVAGTALLMLDDQRYNP